MWDYERLNRRLSEGLQEIARTIAEADGIAPLKPGETRPADFYALDHYTSIGRKPLWLSQGKKKSK